jgi:hypothetical protein
MTASDSRATVAHIYEQANYGDLSRHRQKCLHIELHVTNNAGRLPEELCKYAKSIQVSRVGRLSPPSTQVKKYTINMYKKRAILSSQMYEYTRDEYTEKLSVLFEQFKDEHAEFMQSGQINKVKKISGVIVLILYYVLGKL